MQQNKPPSLTPKPKRAHTSTFYSVSMHFTCNIMQQTSQIPHAHIYRIAKKHTSHQQVWNMPFNIFLLVGSLKHFQKCWSTGIVLPKMGWKKWWLGTTQSLIHVTVNCISGALVGRPRLAANSGISPNSSSRPLSPAAEMDLTTMKPATYW